MRCASRSKANQLKLMKQRRLGPHDLQPHRAKFHGDHIGDFE